MNTKKMNLGWIVLGAVVAVLSIFGLIAFVVLGLLETDTARQTNLINLIAALGGVLGGAAAMIAALVAYVGINTWKTQLKTGKALSILWDAIDTLRSIEVESLRWTLYFHKNFPTDAPLEAAILEHEAKQKKLIMDKQQIFEAHCRSIDVFVSKDGWLWSNNAAYIKNHMFTIEHKLNSIRGFSSIRVSEDDLTKLVDAYREHLKNLGTDLSKLMNLYE